MGLETGFKISVQLVRTVFQISWTAVTFGESHFIQLGVYVGEVEGVILSPSEGCLFVLGRICVYSTPKKDVTISHVRALAVLRVVRIMTRVNGKK